MNRKGINLLENIAQIVVDRRNLVFLIYIILILLSLLTMTWVNVEEDIIEYLAEDSRTSLGVTLMEEEFTTFGMANVMVSNISPSHAKEIKDDLEGIYGVDMVMFEESEAHYKDASALFVITFNEVETHEITLEAMDEIRERLDSYDFSVSTTIGFDMAEQLTKDMLIIAILAVIVIVLVLIFTTQAYAEVPVLLMTFGSAALLNLGTNFIFGKISFISNSVAAVLQLALAIDYAIILSHRFSEENETLPPRESAINALIKAIPEISSSSLTTMAGLAALAFMEFGIGKDLSMVMIKAILLSMLSVFTLMPGLLVLFSGAIKRSSHKSFLPSVKPLGRFSIKTRFIIPPIFAIVLVISFIFSMRCPFAFSFDDIRPHRLSENMKAEDRIKEKFGSTNMMAIIVPSGDYSAEKAFLQRLEGYDEVESALGLSNTEGMAGYMLTDSLTPREFSELMDLDYEMAQVLYSIYAIGDEDYGKLISGVGQYAVPLIDMIDFAYEQVEGGLVSLDEDLMADLEGSYSQLENAKLQMQSDDYSRMFLVINLPVEGDDTYKFLDRVYKDGERLYGEGNVHIVGESINAWDLSLTFNKDNLIISILSALFVIIILTFTFKSAGLPILLISVIQASIWINFSVPYIKNQSIYFLGFLLVSAIQMGANIDYAIVMTSRYLNLRDEMPKDKAVIEALEGGFPTVITSGTILAIAGILIGFISTDGATSVLGSYLGYGTIISMFLVIFVLPQLLYLGDTIIEKTSFRLGSKKSEHKTKEGKIKVKGKVKGYLDGRIDAYVEGTIRGHLEGTIKTKEDDHEED